MNKRILMSLLGILFFASTTSAQLNQTFSRIFDRVLNDDLKLSPGEHARHYLDAAAEANGVLTPGLNALIASNVSSFPLTSTIAGITWNIYSGAPVSIKESLGPILSETAETLGKGKLNIGFNYTYLNLAKFRGVNTEDLRFTFIHEDITKDGKPLGDDVTEGDIIDLILGMDVNANLFAFFATTGITNNLDIGLAIPIVDLRLSGEAQALLNGPFAGSAHTFPGDDVNNPNLTDIVTYEERATGLGDIALRLKYSFVRSDKVNLAVLGDLRVPTGDEKDFLGTGKPTIRVSMIWSKKAGDFTPHLNLGYDRRPAELDSDEFEFAAGFDQKVAEAVTFSIDILGDYDLNNDEAIKFFPEQTVTIIENLGTLQRKKVVDLTNIPQRDNDNTLNAAIGFRLAPSERVLLLGNVLVPMNDGGLRSSVAPTFGLTITF
ncbi:MAG: transporter [Nitrososphaera sp.]